jgi:uncharacterized damage-inducible protein DinB
MTMSELRAAQPACFIDGDALLAHWQRHRRLTRKVIAGFPDDQVFTFSIGGMRTFGSLVMELLTIEVPMVKGIVSDDWTSALDRETRPQNLLRLWDEGSVQLNELWPQIPADRFTRTVTAFGQYPGLVHDLILYAIDNEIHHRGQGYVYLRALGIEPPRFNVRD